MPRKKIQRQIINLKRGEEIIIKSDKRSFIIRGTANGFQAFGKDYLYSNADEIFAGTVRAIVKGDSFSVGYMKDIPSENLSSIPVAEV